MSDLARVNVEVHGSTCVIRLWGEVDISNSLEVSEAIEAGVPSDTTHVAVDLTRTRYLDSAGISLLVRLSERLQSRRQQVKLVVPKGSPVLAVLELTGLPRMMPMVQRLELPEA